MEIQKLYALPLAGVVTFNANFLFTLIILVPILIVLSLISTSILKRLSNLSEANYAASLFLLNLLILIITAKIFI
jgi:hypothetical protein